MQFLMTDQSLKDIPEVITVELEEGRLVCRDRWGALLMSFGHADVVAFGEHLQFAGAFLSERREHRDARHGRRLEGPVL
jgi:hypothetical protein